MWWLLGSVSLDSFCSFIFLGWNLIIQSDDELVSLLVMCGVVDVGFWIIGRGIKPPVNE